MKTLQKIFVVALTIGLLQSCITIEENYLFKKDGFMRAGQHLGPDANAVLNKLEKEGIVKKIEIQNPCSLVYLFL